MTSFESIVEKEFPQLNNILYFDYAGSMPMCKSQSETLRLLTDECAVNPHSTSQLSSSVFAIDEMRSEICNICNTSIAEYTPVFTQNATHSIQEWGNLINWSNELILYYLLDNHNSVLGVRALAEKRGSPVQCVNAVPDAKSGIFIYPMQSNFSGKKYPLQWISDFQQQGGFVFLDAAASIVPDLSIHRPDFVALSLLKLTGSHGGVLLIRRDRISMLSDPLPAGGTVLFSCSRTGEYKLLPSIHQKMEAGTQMFINTCLSRTGIQIRRQLGSEKEIIERLSKLSNIFYQEMINLEHHNGKKLVKFSPERNEAYGSTFSFNMFDNQGKLIGHQSIQYIFDAYNIVARFGGHCNPGAGFPALGWDVEDIAKIAEENEKGGKCVSNLCDINGKPVGTVRISFGPTSRESDIHKLIGIIKYYFIDNGPRPALGEVQVPMLVTKLFVFPIQGALGFETNEWVLEPHGLKYDRNWVLVDANGIVARTPTCTKMAQLEAIIDNDDIVLRINNDEIRDKVCGFDEFDNPPQKVKEAGCVHGRRISDFLFKHFRRFLFLVKIDTSKIGKMAFSTATEESISTQNGDFDPQRWRINLLLKGAPAFSEDGYLNGTYALDDLPIIAWRPRIVCMTTSVNPKTGMIEKEPIQELCTKRAYNGALAFGNLFSVETKGMSHQIKVGMKIQRIK